MPITPAELRKLKVGDLVCDCTCNHQKIVKIMINSQDLALPFDIVDRILYFLENHTPGFIGDIIGNFRYEAYLRYPFSNPTSADFELENGMICNSELCCDSVPHPWFNHEDGY